MTDAGAPTTGGVDRTHGPGGLPRHAFFALHALSLGLCGWVVFGSGLSTLGAWFGSSWSMAVPLRAQLMFAVTALYFVRHGVTLYYLLRRKVTWSEGVGLGAFMIVQEGATACSLQGLPAPLRRQSVGSMGWRSCSC